MGYFYLRVLPLMRLKCSYVILLGHGVYHFSAFRSDLSLLQSHRGLPFMALYSVVPMVNQRPVCISSCAWICFLVTTLLLQPTGWFFGEGRKLVALAIGVFEIALFRFAGPTFSLGIIKARRSHSFFRLDGLLSFRFTSFQMSFGGFSFPILNLFETGS